MQLWVGGYIMAASHATNARIPASEHHFTTMYIYTYRGFPPPSLYSILIKRTIKKGISFKVPLSSYYFRKIM